MLLHVPDMTTSSTLGTVLDDWKDDQNVILSCNSNKNRSILMTLVA